VDVGLGVGEGLGLGMGDGAGVGVVAMETIGVGVGGGNWLRIYRTTYERLKPHKDSHSKRTTNQPILGIRSIRLRSDGV
jgi:hypothetical protein